MNGILVEDLVEPGRVSYDGEVIRVPSGREVEISNVCALLQRA